MGGDKMDNLLRVSLSLSLFHKRVLLAIPVLLLGSSSPTLNKVQNFPCVVHISVKLTNFPAMAAHELEVLAALFTLTLQGTK